MSDEDDDDLSFGASYDKAVADAPQRSASKGSSNYKTVAVARLKHETAKAYLFELADGREVWVPKSVVSSKEVGDRMDLQIADWWCDKNGV